MHTWCCGLAGLTIALVVSVDSVIAAGVRSEKHEAYAKTLWNHLTADATGYRRWSQTETPASFGGGPPASRRATSFANKLALLNPSRPPQGAVIVTQHYRGTGKLAGITAYYRTREGYDARHDDWYWVHFLPNGTVVTSSVDQKDQYQKRGFVTILDDGRLWVFRVASPELPEFLETGELAKHVILPAAGPAGMTLKAPDRETILEYVATKPGFIVEAADGRLWIFREGDHQYWKFVKDGELAKHTIRPAIGPLGSTLKAPDIETIHSYLAAKPGFVTKVEDARIWVFKPSSANLEKFEKDGELAKHVIWPAVGPDGMTVKAPDNNVLLEYLTACEGFQTFVVDGRIWIFRDGSQELKEFLENSELAKHVIRPGAGPGGVTLKAADMETIDAYLRAALP